MNTSSFKDIVRLQFNSLMMIIIKGRVKYHKKQIMKRSKNEVLFCEMSETERLEQGTVDTYIYDYVSFQVMHFVIYVADEELSTALKELTEKQRNAILLYFFQGMNDREISKLYHVSRSAINSRRDRGLRKLQKLLNEMEQEK